MRPWAAEKAGLRRDAYGAAASHHFEGAATHRGQTEAPACGCAFAQTCRTDVGPFGIPPADKQPAANPARKPPPCAAALFCRRMQAALRPAYAGKVRRRKAAHWAAFLPIKRAACPMFGTNRPACVAGGEALSARGKPPRGQRFARMLRQERVRKICGRVPRSSRRTQHSQRNRTRTGRAAPWRDAARTAAPRRFFMPFAGFSCFDCLASKRPPEKRSLLRRLWKKPAALRRPRPEQPRAARLYRACAQADGFFGRGSGTFRAGGRAASGQTAGCKALRFFVPWQNLYGEGSARPRTSG